MNFLINVGRAWARLLTTDSKSPSVVGKLIRAILLLPLITILIVAWQIRRYCGRGFVAEVKADFGASFRCRLPDLIQSYILLFRVWEPDLTQFIASRLRRGDVFIDVGANIGYFTLLASNKVGPEGKVVAIDALPSNYAELVYNIGMSSNRDNVRAINRAVSDSHGTIKVYAGAPTNLGHATTAPGDRKNLRFEASVEAAPLADLLLADEIRQARLLKIDVEGAEPSVLAGIGPFLRQCSQDLEIVLELSPVWWTDPALTPEKVLAPLREAGFNTYRMENDYMPWRYLWPKAVRKVRRVGQLADRHAKQIDLVDEVRRVSP